MAGNGWLREFDEPIEITDGRTLVTLHDAATYITGLPKKESALSEWQAAIEALMVVVVEHSGPTMFARVGIMRALNRSHHLKVFASEAAAETWLQENDPEGVAFEYEVLE